MAASVIVFDPTANDELSRVRGVGRYLQILKENFSGEWIFTNNLTTKQLSYSTIFINPFFNFLQPPLTLKRLAKKQIAVIHDLIPLKYPGHFPAGIKGKINVFLNKLTLKNYDLIITDSEASKKDIIQILNQLPEKVKVVYPCLPTVFRENKNRKEAVTASQKNLSKILFPDPPPNFCIYVGDATWNKNLVNLAKAIKIINVPCVFVGKVFSAGGERRGDPTSRATLSARKHLPSEASEAGAGANQDPPKNPWLNELNQFLFEAKNDQRFIFPGFVPDERLIQLYKQARLNILVSRDEGFGFSYFEAASQGCSSVLSDIPVFRETADSAALFANPNNPNEIADQIGELYFNEELRNNFSQKAKKRFRQFSPEKFKREFLNSLNF
ncbi:MAG: glycosyltransferase family 1 protein [Microgenomates group bacterium]|nr:glycosyltransferase family 1 protein [Microgenomates group bacterium]